MSQLLLFNKPYQVLSQFTDRDRIDTPRATLANFLDAPGYKVAGRLDYDSEGLLLLTDNGRLQQKIANPAGKHWKTYWVQVEGIATRELCEALASGVSLKGCQPGGSGFAQRVGKPGGSAAAGGAYRALQSCVS